MAEKEAPARADAATNVVDFVSLLEQSIKDNRRTPARKSGSGPASKKTAAKKSGKKAASKTAKATKTSKASKATKAGKAAKAAGKPASTRRAARKKA